MILTLNLSLVPARGDLFVIEADSQPLTNPDALTHEVTVIYENPLGIDTESLGDDDIIVGRHSLFGPGLGSAAPLARLDRLESTEDGRRVVAVYLVDRPEGGWFIWEADDLTLQISLGSVRDLEGNAVDSTRVIGLLTLDLAGERPRPISAQLLGEPVIHDLLQSHIDLQVRYTSKTPLRPSDFGSHDLFVRAPREILVPIRLSLSLPLNEHGEVGNLAEARYRVFRPEYGWGTRPLTVYADVLPPPHASQRLGFINLSPGEKLAVTLRTKSSIGTESPGDYHFEVIYTKTGERLDVETLGDDDLIVEQRLLLGPGLQMAQGVFQGAVVEGHRVVAHYRIPEPEGGWESWKQLTPYVRLQSETVHDVVGQSLPTRILGKLPLARDLLPQPQQLVFEDWVRDLSKQLGLGSPPARTDDGDKDGVTDLSEMTFGTDPADASESNPLKIGSETLDGQTFLKLTVSGRPESIGTYVDIEGSVDGREWTSAASCFERLSVEQDTESVTETMIWRSLVPSSELEKRFFRLRVRRPQPTE